MASLYRTERDTCIEICYETQTLPRAWHSHSGLILRPLTVVVQAYCWLRMLKTFCKGGFGTQWRASISAGLAPVASSPDREKCNRKPVVWSLGVWRGWGEKGLDKGREEWSQEGRGLVEALIAASPNLHVGLASLTWGSRLAKPHC